MRPEILMIDIQSCWSWHRLYRTSWWDSGGILPKSQTTRLTLRLKCAPCTLFMCIHYFRCFPSDVPSLPVRSFPLDLLLPPQLDSCFSCFFSLSWSCNFLNCTLLACTLLGRSFFRSLFPGSHLPGSGSLLLLLLDTEGVRFGLSDFKVLTSESSYSFRPL